MKLLKNEAALFSDKLGSGLGLDLRYPKESCEGQKICPVFRKWSVAEMAVNLLHLSWREPKYKEGSGRLL